ncbi:protein kinase family protein [Cellulomonas citrea]|uniref:protein kinase family protein n=1 Tax=Cellulomonas citrea TaxID=1909423 RepID=UPI00135CB84E|nr:protein kinase family protein [Cellulomonas citrea]
MADDAPAGQVIAGRYRLVAVRVDDIPSATTYAAVDTVLDRPILVRLLPGADVAVLDAARRAALVTDARLARVLDVGALPDGRGYVVTQDVPGPSLADLLATGPLSADQARAVVGEAAAALEIARRRGVHHLALRPSVLHVAQDGRIVLAGLSLDAALLGRIQNDETASRTDALDLSRLLYAALTGAWPAPDGAPVATSLPPAPVDAQGQLLAPRSLVADVPADLSTLCTDALGATAAGPRTAGEIVHALEPWGEIRVQPAAAPAGAAAATTVRPRVARTSVRTAFENDAARVTPGTPPPAPPVAAGPFPVGPPTATLPAAPPAAAAVPPPAIAPAAVPPPAFAPAPAAPAADAVFPASSGPAARGPRTDPVPVVQGRAYGSGRRFDPTRLAIGAVVVLILVAVVLGLSSLFSSPPTADPSPHRPTPSSSSATSAAPSPSPSGSATPSSSAPAGAALPISSVTTYDPVDPAGEHQESIQKAFDGDPATTWNTRTYKSATFGGLKPGVALAVTLAAPSQVHSVTLVTTGTGGQIEIRASDPANPQGGAVLASGPLAGTTTFTLDPSVTASSFVIWIAQLPTTADGSYRLELAEITVH